MRKTTNGVGTPFFFQNCWYVKRDGERIFLESGTPEERAYLKATGNKPSCPESVLKINARQYAMDAVAITRQDTTVAAMVDKYLPAYKRTVAPATYEVVEMYLGFFVKFIKGKTISELTANLMKEWRNEMDDERALAKMAKKKNKDPITNNTWSKAGGSVQTMLYWAVEQELIDANPLARKLKYGKAEHNTYLMTPQEIALIRKYASPALRLLFEICLATGARPGEIARLTANHLKETPLGLQAVLSEWKCSKKTGKKRTVYLIDETADMIRELAIKHPTGPLVRTATGLKYTKKIWGESFRLIHKRGLSKDCTLYAARHHYITTALANGVPIAHIAELCGTSVDEITKTYCQLDQMPTLLFAAARATSGSRTTVSV